MHHAIEVGAGGGRTAAFGFVGETMAEAEGVLRAVVFELAELLFDRLFLAFAAAIAQVDVYDGVWGEGGRRRKVHG